MAEEWRRSLQGNRNQNLKTDNKIVLGYEEKLESRISPLFPDQTTEWEAVPHNKERNRKGFSCLYGKKMNRIWIYCV